MKSAALRGPPAETKNPPDAEFGDTRPEGLEADEAGRLPRIIDRLGAAKRRGDSMMGWLLSERNRLVGHGADSCTVWQMEKAGEKLRGCGQLLEFHHYYTVGKLRLVRAFFCKQHLICPSCAIRRGGKLMGRYLHRFRTVTAACPTLIPATMVYTVKNGQDLSERLDHLRAGLRALVQRRRDVLKGKRGAAHTEWGAIVAGVGSIEVTWKPGSGWHPHCHLLVLLNRYVDQPTLSAEWKHLTGDSFIVGVTRLHSYKPGELDTVELLGDFAEVFKYAVKFSSLDPAQTWHCRQVIAEKRFRLLFNFGEFYGVPEPDELTDQPLEGLPYIEHLFRYLRGVGYSYVPPRPAKPDDGSPEHESGQRQADMAHEESSKWWGQAHHYARIGRRSPLDRR